MQTGYSQSDLNHIRKEANQYFKNKNYPLAKTRYESLLDTKYEVPEVLRNLGITYYQLGEYEKSIHLLSSYYKVDNTDVDVIYYLARISQYNLDFDQAIGMYKYFLKVVKPSDSRYRSAIDDLKRCSNGRSIVYVPSLAYVENIGEWVNSPENEIGPVWSRNHNERFYFTSNHYFTSESDTSQTTKIKPANTHSYNMYGTVIDKGRWSAAFPLNENLITGADEYLYGLNSNGHAVYFGSGKPNGTIRLNVNTQPDTGGFQPSVPYDIDVLNDDPYAGDFNFFNDSIIVYSSIRNGGLGGYDLYVTQCKNSHWSNPQNLGTTINSEYDERHPFLAKDGRTLYFASNSLKSIGAYDIFISHYDDASMTWSVPENIGMPINSAFNDIQLTLSPDGQSAILASDRAGSIGGMDLYTVAFKQAVSQQSVVSNPIVFAQVPGFKRYDNELKNGDANDLIISPKIESMYYNSNEAVIVQNNKQALDRLIALGNKFPTLRFNFAIFGLPSNSINPLTEMFFDLKKLEKITGYLKDKGIAPSRISLQSLGSQYPIAKMILEGKPVISGQNLNRRIDVTLSNTDSLPLKVNYQLPAVNSMLKVDNYYYYKKRIAGLSYRIQVISMSQMYKGEALGADPDLLIEADGNSDVNKYLVGLFSTFKQASTLLNILIGRGFNDAFIVPYIDNIRLERGEITDFLRQKYPDLNNYYFN